MPLVIGLFFQRAGDGVMVVFVFSLPFCPTRVPADHGATSYIHTPAVTHFTLSEPNMGLVSVSLFTHPCEHLVGKKLLFCGFGGPDYLGIGVSSVLSLPCKPTQRRWARGQGKAGAQVRWG